MRRYLPLAIFLGLSVAGFGLSRFFAVGWDIWMAVDSATAVALSVLAFLGYLEYIRSEDEIDIVFDVEGQRKKTGLSILRKDCTRSELMGILGMIRKNMRENLDITYMKDPQMLKNLYTVQKGTSKQFVIPLTAQEARQFIIQDQN